MLTSGVCHVLCPLVCLLAHYPTVQASQGQHMVVVVLSPSFAKGFLSWPTPSTHAILMITGTTVSASQIPDDYA